MAKQSLETFKDRLYYLLETVKAERGESRNAFGLRSEVGESNLRNYLRTGTTPGMDKVTAVANAAGFSVDWLLTGKEPMRAMPDDANAPGRKIYPLSGDMVKIPLVDIYDRAYQGSKIEFLEMPMCIITNDINVNPAKLQAFTVRGHSMAPQLELGALALLDTGDTHPGEGIYVVRIDGTVVIKYMQLVLRKGIRLDSFNSDFVKHEPLIVYSSGSETDFAIIGRIIWGGSIF